MPIRAVVGVLDRAEADDHIVSNALADCRVNGAARRPSTEAVFHAVLLQRPGIQWVGHTHPVSVNGILCSPLAHDFATQHRFPDEIVCCGAESLLLPYVDPGLAWRANCARRCRPFRSTGRRASSSCRITA